MKYVTLMTSIQQVLPKPSVHENMITEQNIVRTAPFRMNYKSSLVNLIKVLLWFITFEM